MSTPAFSCILFDLDGTLVDTAPDLGGALNHVLKLNNLAPVTVDSVRDFVGLGARVTIERGFAHYDLKLSEADLDIAHQQFLAYYKDNICKDSRPYEGVQAVLDTFQDQGITLAVCTNKPEDLSIQLLDQLGLSHYFTTICGSDTVPNRKPHPDHIRVTLQRAGAEARSSLMVGDSYADVDAALAAGLPVVAMRYGYTATPSDQLGATIVLDEFHQLPAAANQLQILLTP